MIEKSTNLRFILFLCSDSGWTGTGMDRDVTGLGRDPEYKSRFASLWSFPFMSSFHFSIARGANRLECSVLWQAL